MKRILIRLSALGAMVSLGFIAIAQAQRFGAKPLEPDTADHESVVWWTKPVGESSKNVARANQASETHTLAGPTYETRAGRS